MTSINLGAIDAWSSVYYDYANDIAYVGDDSGKLYKFTGVFKGTPTEVGSPWPVTLSTQWLDSPVYDPVSGNVFVADREGTVVCTTAGNLCGFLYSVNASTGALVAKTAQLDFSRGLRGGFLLDPVAGKIYVFVGADAGTATSSCGANVKCSDVVQLPTNFTNGATGTAAALTLGSGLAEIYPGTFDNRYFTSSNAASPTGNLYLVGGTGNDDDNTLYQIPITSNVMGTPVRGPVLSNNFSGHGLAGKTGSPVSEIFTGSKDYIFTSTIIWALPASACPNSGTVGCVTGYDVTSGTISPTTVPTGGSPSVGASGMIIDNIATSPAGASNIYFGNSGPQLCTTDGTTGDCAIQISQSAP
jgi:hypothetical protein